MDWLFSHVMNDPWQAGLVFAIVVFASVVQFGLGMGFGLTASPLLALIDPVLVPGATLMIGMMTSGWGAWRERGDIHWPEVGTASLGRFVGVAMATVVLAGLASRESFSLIFGAMIGAAVLLSVLGLRLRFTRTNLIAMALLSGLMGTITSVGAPPLAILYQDRAASAARPTLAAFFSIGCAMSLAGVYISGWAGWRDFGLAALMVPAMILGALIARKLAGRFDRRYRPLLLAIAGTAAAILILRAIL
ncbi:MAG: sulfite exporter TauE/SafE family protein [Rhodobacteraceae bacterium]|nr:sulfite exporter TauE/SafE family protein [Paracoccaceae bacterium]MCF8514658.1 sulfite exporter TauE/SafE family protein [Paracoccaceae bacterium]MCF8518801.1 sulfite exporter TauE/SafE family protein [Paracoccaceae bacterium]